MANAPPPASTIRRSSVPLASRDSGGQKRERRALAQQLVLAEAGDRAERRVDLDDLAVAREREALAHRVEDRLQVLGLGADVLDEADHAKPTPAETTSINVAPRDELVRSCRLGEQQRREEDDGDAGEHDEQLAAAALERRPDHRQQDQRAEVRPGADACAGARSRRGWRRGRLADPRRPRGRPRNSRSARRTEATPIRTSSHRACPARQKDEDDRQAGGERDQKPTRPGHVLGARREAAYGHRSVWMSRSSTFAHTALKRGLREVDGLPSVRVGWRREDLTNVPLRMAFAQEPAESCPETCTYLKLGPRLRSGPVEHGPTSTSLAVTPP